VTGCSSNPEQIEPGQKIQRSLDAFKEAARRFEPAKCPEMKWGQHGFFNDQSYIIFCLDQVFQGFNGLNGIIPSVDSE